MTSIRAYTGALLEGVAKDEPAKQRYLQTIHTKELDMEALVNRLFAFAKMEQVFSREDLYELIWGLESMGDNVTVAVHINRLREKIEDDPSHPQLLQTVWGVGYRLYKGER